MKVESEVFYQIARGRNFKTGDKLFFGEEMNGQAKIFDFSFLGDDEKPLHDKAFQESKKLRKDRKLIKEMAIALNNYDLFMREIALESVRKDQFSNLPSRFRCMFLSDDLSVATTNFEENVRKNSNQKIQLIKVRATGEAFYVKDVLISREGLSFNEYKKRAVDFWSQKQEPENKPHNEILFVGEAEIVEILKEN